MTVEEFSNEFDALVDSYRRFKDYDDKQNLDSIEFNEYEKSLYLTKAQESIIEELYSGRNITRESFENTEELRRSLDSLIVTAEPIKTEGHGLSHKDNSYFYILPDNLWFITYESAIISRTSKPCEEGKSVIVTPVTQDDYDRISRNPFRQANNRRVLRLDAGENLVELISKYNIDSYLIRYLKRPTPIILIDLPNGLTINKESTKTECNLNPMIHNMILERAVGLALQSKSIGASR